MSGLWTPSGEHVPGPGEGGVERDAPPGAGEGRGPTSAEEEAAAREELARLQAELLATPVADVVANHAIGLFQLAALHLAQATSEPRHRDEAAVAIDALAAVVETLGTRLAPHDGALSDALAQLRLAFVQVSGPDRGPGVEPSADA